MSKFCQNCGVENSDTDTYCKSCGTALAVANQQMNNGPQMNNGQQMYNGPQMNNYNNYGNATGPAMVPYRNIAITIVLSLVTCGIYGIYWFIVMTDDAKKISNDEKGASGVLAFVYTILTCGIYQLYWYYKQGQRVYQAGRAYNVDIKDNSILYLILPFLGLGIVSYALIQSDLNKFSNGQ